MKTSFYIPFRPQIPFAIPNLHVVPIIFLLKFPKDLSTRTKCYCEKSVVHTDDNNESTVPI